MFKINLGPMSQVSTKEFQKYDIDPERTPESLSVSSIELKQKKSRENPGVLHKYRQGDGWLPKHFTYEGLVHPITLDLCAARNLSNMNIIEHLYDFPAEKDDQEGSESVLINLLTSFF